MDFLQSKKIVWVFAVIGIIIVALAIVMVIINRQMAKPTTTKTNTKTAAELKVDRQEVPPATLPENFPTDIPLEKDAKVIQNYTATTNNGGFQSTREFETKKTLAESYRIYKAYFQQNGWQLSGGVDDTYVKVVSANKGNLTATVTMDYNLKTDIKTIEITITKSP